ncbi:uncharacterized protein LOC143293984 [Babylonia areolata]|uniref:uncharacterized protein LOC143293982 n=1 Tax=Babylonia areolata TaxID=304850 RepID=UPI003FD13B92
MKAVLALTLLVALASAAPQPIKDKRFIESIGHLFHQAADALAHTFNQAKDAFNSLTHGLNINFDSVVAQMIPLIDSGMTETACTTACVGAASTVLGPAAPLAGTVCGPVCKAALAKLEETAG